MKLEGRQLPAYKLNIECGKLFDESLSPRIKLSLAGKNISVVVDTGFNGELMLPEQLLETLCFRQTMKSEAELADGSVVETALYGGKVMWFGRQRSVQVIATESDDGLLGTEMFFGITLFMDLDKGKVVLEKKPNGS